MLQEFKMKRLFLFSDKTDLWCSCLAFSEHKPDNYSADP